MSHPPSLPDPMELDTNKNESAQPQRPPSAGRQAGLPQIPESLAVSHVSPVPALTHSNSNRGSAAYNAPSESGQTSASGLAKGSETKWTDWEERNKCSLNDGIRNIQELDTFMGGLKYPHVVKDEKIVNSLSCLENNKIERMKLDTEDFIKYASWATALKEENLETDDPFQFETWRHALFRDWDSHSSANTKSANEYERRKGVDCMIELAFGLRAGAKHIYRAEEELALPGSPWTAKADATIMMGLPFDWADFLQSLPNSHVFTSIRALLSVITFLFEAKQTDATPSTRQLTLDFCSAQHQRRALGFKDGPVFGATLVGSILTIYVSVWRDDSIVVNSMGKRFDLNTFPAFVRCYFFLCKLAEYVSGEVEEELERWKTDSGKKELEEKNRKASARPWRPKDRPKPSSDVPKKRSRTGEGGAQESDERKSLDENDPEITSMVSSIENGDPVPVGGYPLIVKRLVAHDIYFKKHPNATNPPIVKDVPGWARRSSESDGRLDVMLI